jgi:hypothetical protein
VHSCVRKFTGNFAHPDKGDSELPGSSTLLPSMIKAGRLDTLTTHLQIGKLSRVPCGFVELENHVTLVGFMYVTSYLL